MEPTGIMEPTGTNPDGGPNLFLARWVSIDRTEVWRSLTDSDQLDRWFGTWTGDPSSGTVMVTMTAEAEPTSPSAFTIEHCAPPKGLTVSSRAEGDLWRIQVTLVSTDHPRGTRIELRHLDVNPELLAFIGPGWEWYLDRWVAVLLGTARPSLQDFDSEYLPLGDAYRRIGGDDTAP